MTDDIVTRLTHLRQHHKDGQRSPHKPLLVLLALGQLVNMGSSRMEWSVVEQRLGELLDAFGPSGSRASNPAYPFTRLRADHIWQLSRDVPNDSLTALGEAPIYGSFTPDIEEALRTDATAADKVARTVVEQQFPLSLLADVLSAVGLDPDRIFGAAPLIDLVEPARKRRGSWRFEILEAWDRACAFCGFDGQMSGAAVGVEAAHIRWFNFGGPDEPDNGLALCSLHHKLFDRGVLGLGDPRTVIVSNRFSARSDTAKRVYDLHQRELSPRPGTALPAEAHVEWHGSEVFKGRALT
jgi:putative restriction endonuclease